MCAAVAAGAVRGVRGAGGGQRARAGAGRAGDRPTAGAPRTSRHSHHSAPSSLYHKVHESMDDIDRCRSILFDDYPAVIGREDGFNLSPNHSRVHIDRYRSMSPMLHALCHIIVHPRLVISRVPPCDHDLDDDVTWSACDRPIA